MGIRARNASKKNSAGYSHYLYKGLLALPPFEGDLWRGVHGRAAVLLVLKDYHTLHMRIAWSAFSSATPERAVSRELALMPDSPISPEEDSPDLFPGVTALLFRITVKTCARDVSACSAVPSEGERTLLPNSSFLVTKLAHQAGDGMLELHLSEDPNTAFTY